MPELPEVETVRRVMRAALQGKRIKHAEIVPDDIVNCGLDASVIQQALEGRVVTDIGRKGKFWWIELDEKPWVFGHLGMSGWIRELGEPTIRLKEHGKMPLDDENGRPRFLKMLLESEDGRRIAFTDGRRLGRLWLGADPATDVRVLKLGPDALNELPSVTDLRKLFQKRTVAIKAVLLDQSVISGVGNYLADECLYQARISPKRAASSLSISEVEILREKLLAILEFVVSIGADYEKFPKEWMFHHRWDGKRGADSIDGQAIVREQVGGRTTAWVPALQK